MTFECSIHTKTKQQHKKTQFLNRTERFELEKENSASDLATHDHQRWCDVRWRITIKIELKLLLQFMRERLNYFNTQTYIIIQFWSVMWDWDSDHCR